MAKRFNANDAYLVMRNLVKQATGEETTLQDNDLSAYISAGEKVLASGFENTLESLSIVLGRTIIAVRPYKARASLIRQDDLDLYKTRMRKISYYSDKPLPTGAWNTQVYSKNLERGRSNGQGEQNSGGTYDATKSMWEQHPVIPLEMNFAGFDTWDDAITIYKKQLKIALRDPAEMAKYLNGQMMSKTNDMELEKEAFDTLSLTGYMMSLFAANKVLNNGMAVNMTAEFNNYYGTQYTSEALRTTYLKEFTGFLVAFVKTMVEDFARLSAKRHWTVPKTVDNDTLHILRSTARQHIKMAMYDPFWKKVEATVFPEVFNDQYLTYDNFESFTYWQTDSPGLQAKLSGYTALPDITGTHNGAQYKSNLVSIDYVLGVIFDEDACVTSHALDDADATPLEARKKYYNLWWNFLKNSIVDITEQGCLLYMADNANGGKSTVVDPAILNGEVTFQ